MDGTQTANDEISAIYVAAKHMAGKYGRIGLLDPEDLTQQVMLKVLKANNSSPSIAWLLTVVRNAAYDAMRSATREAKYLSRVDDLDGALSICERADEDGYVHNRRIHPETAADDMEIDLMPHIKNMLQNLSKPQRQVLVLYSEGWSYEEISRLTGANVGTVRSRLHYARRRARNLLGDVA